MPSRYSRSTQPPRRTSNRGDKFEDSSFTDKRDADSFLALAYITWLKIREDIRIVGTVNRTYAIFEFIQSNVVFNDLMLAKRIKSAEDLDKLYQDLKRGTYRDCWDKILRDNWDPELKAMIDKQWNTWWDETVRKTWLKDMEKEWKAEQRLPDIKKEEEWQQPSCHSQSWQQAQYRAPIQPDFQDIPFPPGTYTSSRTRRLITSPSNPAEPVVCERRPRPAGVKTKTTYHYKR